MTEQEAIELLRLILTGAQRSRSIVQETVGISSGPEAEVLAELLPYTFGEGNLVPICARLLDGVDDGYGLAPGDLYNVVFLANRDVLIQAWFVMQGRKLPEADAHWFAGWEEDDEKTSNETAA